MPTYSYSTNVTESCAHTVYTYVHVGINVHFDALMSCPSPSSLVMPPRLSSPPNAVGGQPLYME